jgi:hypothetical protein
MQSPKYGNPMIVPFTMQSHDYVIFLGSEDVMDTDGWMASGRLFI